MATTAVPGATSPWEPEGVGTQLPPGHIAFQGANVQIGLGQAGSLDANGQAYLQDGITPLLLPFGVEWPAKLTDISTAAGVTRCGVWQGFGGMVNSTVANDGFTAADVGGVPAFWAGPNTVGRLSNVAGADRSFAGMAYGLNDDSKVRLWSGPEAGALARAVHSLNAESAASSGYAADASATTDLGSLTGGTALLTIGQVLTRTKRHGQVLSIEIIPGAALSAAGTNFRVIQLWKVDTTGAVALASSPLVATFTTATQALVAGQPTLFTPGAASALLMRETDILVLTSIHTGTGAVVPQSAIRANFQVI